MSKRLGFEIQLTVSDGIDEQRAREVIEAMLADLIQDEDYHEILVLDKVSVRDESTLRLLEILDNISEENVEKAIDSLDTLEKDDE